jgi:hypothetical protein
MLKSFGFWTRYFIFADQVPVFAVPISPRPKKVAAFRKGGEGFQRGHSAKPIDPDG